MNEALEFIKTLDMQKIIELLIAIGVIVLFRVLSPIIAKMVIKILTPKPKEKKDIKKNPFYLPIKTIISFFGIYIALNMIKVTLNISNDIITIITQIIKILMILLVAKAFGDGLDYKNIFLDKIKSQKNLDETTFKLIIGVLKAVIYIIAGFMVISELNYDISGFVAGLGIGSVVITLAAQDTAKSLIGGLAIFMDRPFKVGDYIKVDTYEGTVEDIKFRSTSIRTGDNSVLHIPNSEMAASAIINYSEMQLRRFYLEINLEIDSNLDKMENVRKRIEELLNSGEDIKQDTINVRFQSISTSGLMLMIIAYVTEINYSKFLLIKENLNYNIMKILRDENINIACTQTIDIKK